MVWKPHVTVAAVVEKDNRFLLVEEETSNGLRFNQPAGHLEENEDLYAAVKREAYEESGWQFEPEHIVSVQLWRKKPSKPTFLRVSFSGYCHSHNPKLVLDAGIVATHWLTRDEIAEKMRQNRLRSPLVLITVDEYLSGQRYPLSLIKSYFDTDHV